MGLLGFAGGHHSDSSEEDSDHGLSDSEDEGGPAQIAGLRHQIHVQAQELTELQDRVQDLLEKVGGIHLCILWCYQLITALHLQPKQG